MTSAEHSTYFEEADEDGLAGLEAGEEVLGDGALDADHGIGLAAARLPVGEDSRAARGTRHKGNERLDAGEVDVVRRLLLAKRLV